MIYDGIFFFLLYLNVKMYKKQLISLFYHKKINLYFLKVQF